MTDRYISQWVLRHTFDPDCLVDVYQLKYQPIGGQGEPATASAVLMIPAGRDVACETIPGKMIIVTMCERGGSRAAGLFEAL